MTKRSLFLGSVFVLQAALAGAMDMELRNPAIDALKSRIAARAAALQKWKDSGAVGEEARGTVLALPQAKLSLSERKEVRDLVLSENEDRAALFRELIFANSLSEAELPNVAGAFAKKQRDGAAPAHFVEDPNAKTWVQKKDLR